MFRSPGRCFGGRALCAVGGDGGGGGWFELGLAVAEVQGGGGGAGFCGRTFFVFVVGRKGREGKGFRSGFSRLSATSV